MRTKMSNPVYYPLFILGLLFALQGCGGSGPQESGNITSDAPSSSAAAEKSEVQGSQAPLSEKEIAGFIFGEPVPITNYYFAKRVHDIFQMEGEKDLSPEDRQMLVFKNLTYHREAYLRKIEVTDEEMDQWIASIFAALELDIKPKEDPEGYKKWVEATLRQDVPFFENQMRYMAMIEKLKREMVKEMKVEVTEEEMKEDFLNIANHVGGEYIIFDTKEEAEKFHETYKDPAAWEALKEGEPDKIKPFSMITVQAIIDLWGVPKDIIYDFHSQEIGTVFRPMPFGKKWGVFRLMDKRTGDLKDFAENNEENRKRVEIRKQYEARNQWLEDVIVDAKIQITVPPDPPQTEQSAAG